MRKITQQAIAAFESFKDFKSGNTKVEAFNMEDFKMAKLFLHNNCIAELVEHTNGKKTLVLNSCGWKTTTTKERLNGIFGIQVNQKNYSWYLNGEIWNGKEILLNWQNGRWTRAI